METIFGYFMGFIAALALCTFTFYVIDLFWEFLIHKQKDKK